MHFGRRRPPTLKAGSVITGPRGNEIVLPKDWKDLTIDDLVELGLGPGQGGETVSGFIPFGPGAAEPRFSPERS